MYIQQKLLSLTCKAFYNLGLAHLSRVFYHYFPPSTHQ